MIFLVAIRARGMNIIFQVVPSFIVRIFKSNFVLFLGLQMLLSLLAYMSKSQTFDKKLCVCVLCVFECIIVFRNRISYNFKLILLFIFSSIRLRFSSSIFIPGSICMCEVSGYFYEELVNFYLY